MTDSIKNLASSVDWSKLMSGSDARNALVGSALGGLLMGGAGLMQDRDPEESKFAPVGDALMGALLGGVAGYGIPKGLAMFRDSGTLAPDNDQLSGGYGKAMRNGAIAGGAVGVGTAIPSAVRASWKSLIDRNNAGAPRRGFWREITRNMVREKPVEPLANKAGVYARVKHALQTATNGRQFRSSRIPLPLKGLRSLRVLPEWKVGLKGGKYALGGAALAAIAHGLFGNSARDNFKN